MVVLCSMLNNSQNIYTCGLTTGYFLTLKKQYSIIECNFIETGRNRMERNRLKYLLEKIMRDRPKLFMYFCWCGLILDAQETSYLIQELAENQLVPKARSNVRDSAALDYLFHVDLVGTGAQCMIQKTLAPSGALPFQGDFLLPGPCASLSSFPLSVANPERSLESQGRTPMPRPAQNELHERTLSTAFKFSETSAGGSSLGGKVHSTSWKALDHPHRASSLIPTKREECGSHTCTSTHTGEGQSIYTR